MWPFSLRQKRKKPSMPVDEGDVKTPEIPSEGAAGSRGGNVASPPSKSALLLDLPERMRDVVESMGFRVSAGSLGTPYRVEQGDSFVPVVPNHDLPTDWAENELVIIDLLPRTILDSAQGDKVTSPGEPDWWAKCSQGVIDPRPRTAVSIRDRTDRMYRHGTGFLIFMAPEVFGEFAMASVGRYRNLDIHNALTAHPWSFLSLLHHNLDVTHETGNEVRIADGIDVVADVFGPYVKGASYLSTLRWTYGAVREKSAVLLTNKFEEALGVVTNYDGEEGVIVLLPRFEEAAAVSEAVMQTLLPLFLPDLFPDRSAQVWLSQSPYEHTAIEEIAEEIEEVERHARQTVEGLRDRADQIRQERSFLHTLLVGSGDDLKDAVHQALVRIGCQRVIDVDRERERVEGKLPAEDLRIEDRSPLLLVEVKGILGRPSDEDALQVTKYLAPRMKELGRTDIQGVSVINHERHRPPHDRNKENVFRELVLENASQQGIGLLTSWDLFRLVRNVEVNTWPQEAVLDILYSLGRLDVVPSHYAYVGSVVKWWPEAEAIGLIVEGASLVTGSSIAVEREVLFEELTVESLMIDSNPVDRVEREARVGVRVLEGLKEVSVGTRVFVIARATVADLPGDGSVT